MDEGLYNVCNQLGICMTGPPPVLGAYLLKSSTKCDHAQGFSTPTNVLIGRIQRFLLATCMQE